MKLLIIGMLAFAPITSFAITYYGDSNSDLTTISVVETSMLRCEISFNKAHDKLRARNKDIIDAGQCAEAKSGNGSKFFAVIKFHKYL